MIRPKVLPLTTTTGPASVSIPTTRTRVHLPSSSPLAHHPQRPVQRAFLGRGTRHRKLQAPQALPEDSTVVGTEWLRRNLEVYDDGGSMTAARVWWSLLLYGHPRPYILAGGWDAWRAGGGGSELYEPCPLKSPSLPFMDAVCDGQSD
eukprot:XP_001700300.1 predicted protein [Chlamydomonas reinhardtii]